MKPDIHPKYYNDCKVVCACGNSYITGSILPEIRVDVCSACHPFYTGKEKFIDTEGRVERFKRKVDVAKKVQEERKAKMVKKIEKKQVMSGVKSLKDLLKEAGK
ncbi:50S ribosomal protein L31 [Patescibacteria group bacterium]|nr:50S ribosomal protein L31 [Patescibacteria group bacterium]MBU4381298.1 50S ribosomal protein L31 [Patescibacteria group bacterium]